MKKMFVDLLKNDVNWMNKDTKDKSILKAEKMAIMAAYHDELLNDQTVEDIFDGVNNDLI